MAKGAMVQGVSSTACNLINNLINTKGTKPAGVVIEGVSGNQFTPDNHAEEFKTYSYQYATTTYGVERGLSPALIVQPKSIDDIAKTLQYAKDRGIAVAIRSGGHAYSGDSSTSAPNIQLDLRYTFKGADDRVLLTKGDESFVRTSVSWSLGEFNEWLGSQNVFVPHGQCEEVHVGGHVQTGGYGQLARSFGLLGDHVVSLEVVDTHGELKEVTKASDPELFFALLGGSPGNLGVLTHFTIKVHRDQDYSGSRGMKGLFLYDAKTLQNLATILAEMADDENFPGNYDLCVSVVSSSFPLHSLFPDQDQLMAEFHKKVYGKNHIPVHPRAIVVYAQWVPLKAGDVCDMTWFDRIRNAGSNWLQDGHFACVAEKPMSVLSSEWIFRNVREFEHPYVKRCYVTNSRTLNEDGWPAWVTERIDAIVRPEANRAWLSVQLQCFGGRHSAVTKNAGNGTAYSWRDASVGATMDCFHTPETRSLALDWQKVNDMEAIGPKGVFSKQDKRWLWGSYGEWDLDSVWSCYYEDKEKYEKLQQVRKRVDPYGIFTPNPFSVKRAE